MAESQNPPTQVKGMIHVTTSRCQPLCAVVSVLMVASTVQAAQPEWANPQWAREDVDWRMPGGLRVKGVLYPPGKQPLLRSKPGDPRHRSRVARGEGPLAAGVNPALVGIIQSPPVAGFVPYIAVTATDDRDEPLATAAIPQSSVTGNYFIANPETNYAIGLFDTGASTTVLGNDTAQGLGLYSGGVVTSNPVQISGVSGSVTGHCSEPLGLFIGGLQSIDAGTMVLSMNSLLGESNVSAAVLPPPTAGAASVTAIGASMAVFLAADVRNSQPVTRVRDGVTYTAPTIHLYNDLNDPAIPEYPNLLPLELRPEGGFGVDYYPCVEVFPGDCPGGADNPTIPSMVSMLGFPLQSLFFVSSSSGVDLHDNGRTSLVNDAFMVDTGAQVTVIGSGVGARLALNPSKPDFQVEVQGVNGEIVYKPGFFIDLVEMPALGEILSFSHVPVVLLDVASPEGGNLDGIIGMNLFEQYDFVLRGGGLFNQGAPELLFQRVRLDWPADFDGDEDVDAADVAFFTACGSGAELPIAPGCEAADLDGDQDADMDDFGILQRCFAGPDVTPPPTCGS